MEKEFMVSDPETKINKINGKRVFQRGAVVVFAWLAGVFSFVLHGQLRFGHLLDDLPADTSKALLLSFVFLVPLLLAIFVPAMLLVARFIDGPRLRYFFQFMTSLVLGALSATYVLVKMKHFHIGIPGFFGRTWNVYLYFGVLSLVFGLGWILEDYLFTRRARR